MATVALESLSDKLIEYVLDGLSDYGAADEGLIRRVKAMKLSLQERHEGVWYICVGMGIYEAAFSVNGEKKAGAVGGSVERLISNWLSRPLNQEAIKSLIKK